MIHILTDIIIIMTTVTQVPTLEVFPHIFVDSNFSNDT